MKWNKWALLLLIGVQGIVNMACSRTKGVKEVAEDRSTRFVLPEVPSTISTEEGRLHFLAVHYWDHLNLADRSWLADRETFERTFVDYVYLVSTQQMSVADSCIAAFVQTVSTDSLWLRKVMEAAAFYLYDVGSPIANEAVYVPFVQTALASPLLTEEERVRYTDQLEVASKNNPGMKAADFNFQDRNGKLSSLYAGKGKVTILFFGDPECEGCKESIQLFRQSRMVEQLIRQGELELLMVYTEGDETVWNSIKETLPAYWRLGFDRDASILMQRRYELRAMPSIYLLDGECNVILKDKTAEVVIAFLEESLK